MKLLPILSERASLASSRLVNCKGCTSCCERGGLVFVRDEEIAPLRRIGVPIITIGNVAFIKRLPDGSCPMLDRKHKKCSIYENRPQCCRLFPLDVLTMEGELKWALSTQCPSDRKRFDFLQGPNSAMGSGSVGHIASNLEMSFDEEDLSYFKKKERVSVRVELIEDDQNVWASVASFSGSGTFDTSSKMSAKKPESKRDKLKRKLQERRRKKEEEKKKKKKGK